MLLAAVSGGLDSVAMLYLLLTETTRPIHVHHVRIVPRIDRGRWRVEGMAVDRILPWLQKRTRPFVWSESQRPPAMVRDADIVIVTEECAKVGLGIYGRDGITGLARGANAHDMVDGATSVRQRAAAEAWRRMLGSSPPPIEFPVAHMTRDRLWAMLPPELAALTWSCRTPMGVGAGRYRPCRACHACRELMLHNVPMERAYG